MRLGLYALTILGVMFTITNIVYADNDYLKYQRYQDFERASSPEKVKQGQAVYQQYCVRCHGVDGTASPRRDVKPIAYLHPAKIFEELMDYRTENDSFEWDERPMIDVTRKLTYPELEAVALYIGTLRR